MKDGFFKKPYDNHKAKVRRKAAATMEPHYSIYWKGSVCYYCGDLAFEMDHCPAISIAYTLGSDYFYKKNIKFLKVSACRECNSVLKDKQYNTLHTRVRHLYDYYQIKYDKYLKIAEWTPEDIAELSGWLRDYVQIHSDFKEFMERRFMYMEDLHYDIL